MNVVRIADNILSPLGLTTADNLQAVREGRSALRLHELWQIPEHFMASLFEEGQLEDHSYEGALRQSITTALTEVTEIDKSRTLLVLSSTKGQTTGPDGEVMGATANRLARHFGFGLRPVTVSNACISGLSAQIVAMRMLEMGICDYAVVAGCDIQTKFIVSGFQSFHAVSDEECRPFDEDRFGLNLGEAAATIVYARREQVAYNDWCLTRGSVRNDAFHISGPSRTAEGSYRALRQVMEGVDKQEIACLSPHGTATLYNDDMESKAIGRTGLDDLLVSGLKGYYGHTMGAAGVLETIVTMHAIDDGWVPATRGYTACGTTCPLRVTAEHEQVSQRKFVKMMSGFGGCNAVALFQKGDVLSLPAEGDSSARMSSASVSLSPVATIRLTSTGAWLNDNPLASEGTGEAMLKALYKQELGDYPKFYKMDPLARAGFLASELLLKSLNEPEVGEEGDETRAVIFVNRSASFAADRKYEDTIVAGENYFPSPGDFVYTLPNIVTGEIAIRHHYHGETTFMVIDERDEPQIEQLIGQAFCDPMIQTVLGGWVECQSADDFDVKLGVYVRN